MVSASIDSYLPLALVRHAQGRFQKTGKNSDEPLRAIDLIAKGMKVYGWRGWPCLGRVAAQSGRLRGAHGIVPEVGRIGTDAILCDDDLTCKSIVAAGGLIQLSWPALTSVLRLSQTLFSDSMRNHAFSNEKHGCDVQSPS